MSIRFKIHPELPVILYVCEGMITATEFFKAEDLAALDKDYRAGMVTIIDIISAGINFELQDMHHVIDWANNLEKQKIEYGETVILTNDLGINISVAAINLMAPHTRLNSRHFRAGECDPLIRFIGLSGGNFPIMS